MALHFLSTPMRTIIRPTPRTEFRYLYTSYYMSHLNHKVCPDQTTSHNHLSSDFVNDPTPISPFSSTSSPVHGSPRHFATSVNDASKWLNIKKKVGHATGLCLRPLARGDVLSPLSLRVSKRRHTSYLALF